MTSNAYVNSDSMGDAASKLSTTADPNDTIFYVEGTREATWQWKDEPTIKKDLEAEGANEDDINRWFGRAYTRIAHIYDREENGDMFRYISCGALRALDKANDKDFTIKEGGTFDYVF